MVKQQVEEVFFNEVLEVTSRLKPKKNKRSAEDIIPVGFLPRDTQRKIRLQKILLSTVQEILQT